MKMKYLFVVALANLKSGKAKTLMNIIIIAICMAIYIIAFCIFNSINDYKNAMVETKMARTLLVFGENVTKDALESIRNVDRVVSISPNWTLSLVGSTFDFSESGNYKDEYGVLLTGYYDHIITAVSEGANIQEGDHHVGIIPNYFQPSLFFDSSEYTKETMPYLNGNDFIGHTLFGTYSTSIDDTKPPSAENTRTFEYSFKVIGVYDVLENRQATNMIFVPMNDLKEIYDNISPNRSHSNFGIIVDESANIPLVCEELDKLQFGYFINADPSSIIDISVSFAKMAKIVSMIALGFLVFGVLLLVLSSIRQRQKEIAIIKALGYQQHQLFMISILESACQTFWAMILTILLTAFLLFVLWTPIITNTIVIYYSTLKVDPVFYFQTVLQALLIGVSITALSSLVAYRRICKIQPSLAMKE